MVNESNERGTMAFGGNELEVYSVIEDPSAYRGGAVAGRGLFKLSGNRVTVDAAGRVIHVTELCLMQAKLDEDGNGGWLLSGQLAGTSDDKGMIDLMWLGPTGIRFLVPVLSGPLPPGPEPPPQPPPTTPPPPSGGAVHGINPGDFSAVLRIYGFASDDEAPYREGRMSWSDLIARQDRRDDYRHFPRQ